MKFAGFLTSSLILAISFSLCQSVSAQSEDASVPMGFFNRDSVSDMRISMEQTVQPEISYGPSKRFKIEQPAEIKKESAENGINQKQVQAEQEKDVAKRPDPQAYALEKEFGKPTEPVAVKGVDTAPKPYKAMLKAIEMGRDDLALSYANQWVGYIGSLDRVTRKAAAMANIAKLDPYAADANIPVSAFSSVDPEALSNFIEKKKEGMAANKSSVDVEIAADSRKAINAFFGESDSLAAQNKDSEKSQDQAVDQYAKLVDFSMDPARRKQLIRSELQGSLPLDPDGKVQVLLFIRPSEQASIEVSREVIKAVSSSSMNVPVAVVPFTVESSTHESGNSFLEKTGIAAIPRDGLALAQRMNISQFPSIVFTSADSDRAFVKSGPADAVFVEEVVRMIGGK